MRRDELGWDHFTHRRAAVAIADLPNRSGPMDTAGRHGQTVVPKNIYGKVGVRALAIVSAAVFSVGVARAAPPAEGTPQYEMLHPYADWIGSVHNEAGALCCAIADGAVVQARQRDGHWQVMFDPSDKRIQAPPGWLDVPDEHIVRVPNPTGAFLAWWFNGEVRCFVTPDAS